MKQRCQRWIRFVFLVLTLVLSGFGCSGIGGGGSIGPAPIVPATRADLTAIQLAVERARGDHKLQLKIDEPLGIQEGDQISVHDQGRALLRFPDRLLVEIFRSSESLIREARLTPEGFIFVRLKQIAGTTRVQLESMADARVVLETEYAVIRAVDSDTEFVACHSEKVTCMVTLKGKAEVEAQGVAVVVLPGESSYVFPGQPPQPPICAQMPELVRWMDQKRGVTEIVPLGTLVAQWPQRACSSPTPHPETTVRVEVSRLADAMSRIEAGQYLLGLPQSDDFHIPWKIINLSTFWIDKYEVTNAQYRIFLEETDQLPPVSWVGGTFPSGMADHPVKGIGWEEASDYCVWADKLLPTEAQWEVAARGPGQEPPLYPWGADSQAGGEVNQLPLNATYEVGSKPFNRSAFDVYDMSGNVWEWVGEPYSRVQDGHKVLRGGRHGLLLDMAYRQPAEPNDARFVLFAGIRCATEVGANG